MLEGRLLYHVAPFASLVRSAKRMRLPMSLTGHGAPTAFGDVAGTPHIVQTRLIGKARVFRRSVWTISSCPVLTMLPVQTLSL